MQPRELSMGHVVERRSSVAGSSVAGSSVRGAAWARAGVLTGLAGLVGLAGCAWDSFLDPSVVGRWEQTPTSVPILESLAAIEETGEEIEYTEVSAEDLLPQPDDYTIGAGDVVTLTLWDLVTQGQPEIVTRTVDQNGFIDVVQLGRVRASGLTEEGLSTLLIERMRPYVLNPLVSVVIESRRAQSFFLQGNVQNPGAYAIPSADYKLLEALIAAGGVQEATSTYVYVIRQVALTEEAATGSPSGAGSGSGSGSGSGAGSGSGSGSGGGPVVPTDRPFPVPGQPGQAPADGDSLLEIIDELSGDDARPAMLSALQPVTGGNGAGRGPAAPTEAAGPEPLVDLVEPARPAAAAVPLSATVSGGAAGGPRWVYVNGRWMLSVSAGGGTGAGAASAAGAAAGDGLPEGSDGAIVTQRVIRVPVKPLLSGDARYNLVVRGGDTVRVPPPVAGNVYMAGQVNRPGVYTLPPIGRLTMTRAITAAGGLSNIGIPERVDLTRMVGPDRQATIMLNLRAIAEGTQPDVFLKPDDQVNVGTNFWALPLAVFRGGLRASYGFGFLLDRNFGNDVFGVPPGVGVGQ